MEIRGICPLFSEMIYPLTERKDLMRVYSMTKRRPRDITLHCRVNSDTLAKIDIARMEDKLTRSAWLAAAIDDRLSMYILSFGHFPIEDKD